MNSIGDSSRLSKYKCPGAKRLMLEAQEMRDKTEDYSAQPVDDNLFEWHFTLRGPPDTPFDGGFYHGRLSFPTEYPMKPPSIYLLTPNGRFETNKKICLSISGYHPETWLPSWSVRTALLALIGFMPTEANRAVGSLDYSNAERRFLAKKSASWKCDTCGHIKDLLKKSNNDSINLEQRNELVLNGSGTLRLSSELGQIIDIEQEDLKVSSRERDEKTQHERYNDAPRIESNTTISSSCMINNNESNNLEPQSETVINNGILQTSQSASRDQYEERSSSNMMLKSIFILLLILLVRRMLMLILF